MRFRYKQPLEDSKFKALNKDRFLDKYFQTSNVGQCQKLFNEYYTTSVKLDRLGWEKYYNDNWGWHRLDALFKEVKDYCSVRYNLTEYQCKKWIFHRVIGQTWNGLIKEEELIKIIIRYFPKLNFQKTIFEVDKKYCIDWEVFNNDNLVVGLQIKPISYKVMHSKHQLKVKDFHKRQNEKYRELFAPYYYVYYDKKGIVNLNETINYIKEEIKYITL